MHAHTHTHTHTFLFQCKRTKVTTRKCKCSSSVTDLQVVKLYLDIPTWMFSDTRDGQYMLINLDWALEQKKVLPAVAQQLKTVYLCFANTNIPLNLVGFLCCCRNTSPLAYTQYYNEYREGFPRSAESCTLRGGASTAGPGYGIAF